jgi:hypothetical protein
MNDLDIGWINMHTMLIYNVSGVLDRVHAEGKFLKFII